MMSIRRQIMALPADQRLDVALQMIDDLTGQGDRAVLELKERFDLSRQEAQLLAALNARAPEVVTREALYVAIYGIGVDRETNVINVLVYKVRRAMLGHGFVIRNCWGVGYSLSERIVLVADDGLVVPVPVAGRSAGAGVTVPARKPLPGYRKVAARGEPWAKEDDDELCRMVAVGSDWWAVADELGRTERACRDRFAQLRNADKRVTA